MKKMFLVLIVVSTFILMPLTSVPGSSDSLDEGETLDEFPQPSKPTGYGPHGRGYILVQVPRTDAPDARGRIYYPAMSSGQDTVANTTGAPWPTVIFVAGGNGSANYANTISSRISSWGFVVVNVDLGNVYGNGGYRDMYMMLEEMGELIDWMEDQNDNSSFFLYQMMDMDKLGISGHSWGGICAAHAVTDKYGDPRIKASFPISAQNLWGQDDYTKDAHVPIGLISGSNEIYQQDKLFEAGNAPMIYIKVVGSDHSSILSTSHPYAVAFFKYWLSGETEYEHWIYTDGIEAEDDTNTVRYFRNLIGSAATISTDQATEDETITFSVDADGLIIGDISFEWDYDGDGTYDWTSDTAGISTKIFTDKVILAPECRISDDYETDILEFELKVSNVEPKVEAMDDVLALEEEVESFDITYFNDTTSDIDDLEYSWDFGDGVLTDRSTTTSTEHAYDDMGNYTVTVWVRDDDGATSNDTLTVEVQNLPPSVDAGNDVTTTEDETVEFNGLTDDSANDLTFGLDHRWDYGDGNASDWEPSANSQHVYTASGNYTATLYARDQDGHVGSDILNVTVLNSPPVVMFLQPDAGSVFSKDAPITFKAEAEDLTSDGPFLVHRWDFGDGTGTPWGAKLEVSHTYHMSGDYTITFSAKDPEGMETVVERDIIIENSAPIVEIQFPKDKVTVNEDEVMVFTADATDVASDEGNLSYTWQLDGEEHTGPEIWYVFKKSGVYEVKVNVTDWEGASSQDSISITVKNVGPFIHGGVEPRGVLIGEEVNYTCRIHDSPSDLDGLVVLWDFGDGNTSSSGKGDHTYSSEGTYDVVVTVTDDDGAAHEARFTVNVTREHVPEPPRPHNGNGGLSMAFIAGIVAIVIVIVVIIIILLLFKTGRTGGEGEPPQETTPMTTPQQPLQDDIGQVEDSPAPPQPQDQYPDPDPQVEGQEEVRP